MFWAPFVIFSYNSFIAVFGYLEIFPPPIIYRFYTSIISVGALGVILSIINWSFTNRERRSISVFLITALWSIPIPIILSIIYSFSIDYQAQGRYILPALIRLCILITKGLVTWWKHLPERFRFKWAECAVYLCFLFANVASIYSVYLFFHVSDFMPLC